MNISGTPGNDNLNGTIADDLIEGLGGNDFIRGGTGNDTVNGGDGNDFIEGEAGNDTLNGQAGDDSLYGGEGNDALNGGDGDDYLDPGIGADQINGGAGIDRLYLNYTTSITGVTVTYNSATGTTSDSKTIREVERVTFDGSNSNDVVDVSATNAFSNDLEGNDGDDTLIGGSSADYIYGETGNDTLRGNSDRDYLYGGIGNDTLDGGEGDDYLDPGTGADQIVGGAGTDELYLDYRNAVTGVTVTYNSATGTTSDGKTIREVERVTFDGSNSNDVVDVSATNAFYNDLEGNDGDDTLKGGSDADYIYGEEGNDTLSGNGGRDYLYGGVGNDTLDGGENDDYLDPGTGADQIVGGTGTDELYLDYRDAATGVTVTYNSATGTTSDGKTIREVERITFDGSNNNDVVDVSATSTFYNDLEGNGGDDTLRGGSGTDYIYGEEGNDTLSGNGDRDYLYGGAGNDTLNGGAGNDSLFGGADADQIFGEAGNDELHGEAGNDTLSGGEGDDYLDPGAGVDQVDGGTGNDGLFLDLSTSTTPVTITFNTSTSGTISTGTTFQNVENFNLLTGSSNDTVNAGLTTGNVWVRSNAGNDTIQTGTGRDKIEGGEGDDIIRGGAGDDSGFEAYPGDFERIGLFGGAGNDQIFGETGNDELYGEAGNDTLSGGEGDDYLDPGTGADQVDGGLGNDGLFLDLSTSTTSTSITFNTSTSGTISTGTTFQNIENFNLLTGSGSDTVSAGSATGNIWVRSNAGNDTIQTGSGRDKIEGGEGDDIIRGGAGDDSGFESYPGDFERIGLFGGVGNDQIFGEVGNDELYGEAGNDTLNGGEGDDYLDPGAGADQVDGGTGNDGLFLDLSTSTTPISTVFDSSTSGTISTGTTFQNVENFNLLTGSGNDTINATSATGNIWIRSNAGNDTIQTGTGRDKIEGGEGDDIIRGGAGDDSGFEAYPGDFERIGLYGGTGNDQIFGEAGSDELYGEAGDDLLVGVDSNSVNPGLGEQDILSGGAGADRFILGTTAWIAYDDRNATTNGNNDYATITDFNVSEDKVQLQGPRSNYRLEVAGSNTRLLIDKAGSEPDELIAIFENATGLDLNSSAFEFVNPVNQISFSSATYSANEAGTATVILTRAGNSTSEVSATLLLSNGTAIAPADYNNTPITVTFASGESSKTVTIPIVNDTQFEPNETLNLSLTNLTGGATIGTQGTATLTIVSDDPPASGALSFSSPTFTVREDGSAIAAVTVNRSGGSDGAVSATISLTNGTAIASADYNATPIVVTFADGETSKTVTIPIVNDTVSENNETINLALTAPTGGATLGTQNTAVLAIVDDEVQLNFSASSYTVREDGTAVTQVVITRSGRTTGIVGGTIAFADGTATGCSCGPNSVNNDFHNGTIEFTLADGETSKIIPVELATLANPNAIRIRNDEKVEGDETFTISLTNPTGGATIGSSGSAIVTILDDDTALTFGAANFRVREDGTAIAAVTVNRTGKTTGTVSATLNLTDGTATSPSDYTNAPITVSFADGETSKTISIPVRTDLIVEGDETINLALSDPTGGAKIGAQGTAVLTIADLGVAPTLTLTFDKSTIAESAGNGAATGTITRNIITNEDLVVTLASSDTTEATVPTTVTIRANQASANFLLNAVNDGVSDGSQSVTVSANASGFNAGTATVAVTDVNVSDLQVTSLSANNPLFTSTQGSVTYRVENTGLSATSGSWVDRIYLSTDTLLDANDALLSENPITANIPAGQFYQRSVTFFTPRTAGQYYLIANTDATNTVNEGGTIGDSNNTRVTPISLTPAYRATVSTTVEQGVAGQSVSLQGRAIRNGDDTPVPFEFVTIAVKNRGIVRELSAFTDINGNFSTTFNPLPGEGGQYEVNAYFPGFAAEDTQPEDSFKLLGAKFENQPSALKVLANSPYTGQVNLQNLTDIPLTGLTYTVEGAPADWVVQVNAPQTLAGAGTNTVSYTITAPNNTVIVQDAFNIRFNSAEGVTGTLPLNVNVERVVPRLVANLTTIESGMLRERQTAVEFEVTNEGGSASGEVQVNVPNAPWLSLASPVKIPSLAPGESTKVTLLLTPDADLPLTLYKGNVFLDVAGNDGDLSVPFEFRATSEATGRLNVSVVNELTFFTQEAPKLAGATVILRDYFTGEEIRSITTDATGMISFDQVPEGAYTLEVRAKNHETFKQTVQIDAGEVEQIQSFLSRQTVRYIWNVTPTEIQDRYTISVESVFETNVPVPTLTIDPPVIDLAELDVIGEVLQIDMTVTNHGLIAANDVKLNFGDHPFYRIEPLIDNAGTLSAKSSLTIPVKITRIADFDSLGTQGGELSTLAAPSVPCGLGGALIWGYICGPTSVSKSSAIAFNNVDGNTNCGFIPYGYGGGGSGDIGSVPVIIDSSFDCNPCIAAIAQSLFECAFNVARNSIPGLAASAINSLYDIYSTVNDLEEAAKNKELSVSDVVGAASTAWGFMNLGIEINNEAGGLPIKIPYGKLINRILTPLECALDLYDKWEESCKDGANQASSSVISSGLPGNTPSTLALSPSSTLQAGFDLLKIQIDRLQKIADSQILLFGDSVWFQDEDGLELSTWAGKFQETILAATNDGFKISSTERDTLLNTSLPTGVTGTDVNKFIDRWNRSIDYWRSGIFNLADLPSGQNSDFLSIDRWNSVSQEATDAIAASQTEGFPDFLAGMSSILQELQQFVDNSNDDGVCARVRIRIDQDAVMTRSAFLGELEIENGNDTVKLENISVTLQVRDDQGNVVNNLFGIQNPILQGLNAVDGTGILLADSTGSAEWTIIPTNLAAASEPTQYSIGGTLSYTENGNVVTVPLLSTPVTVYPQAELYVDYFHERNVYADDPFTDPVEPSVPYSLGILVRNEGKGAAKNLEITSSQPKIIENEKGLLIGFEIIGTQVGTEAVKPDLTVNFGNIAPGQTAVADWLFKSSLQGKFIDYSASFKHVNDLGNSELSLLKEVKIHELIRKVRVNNPTDDQLPDFLVNDEFDAKFYPDTLYFSNGSTAPVRVVDTATSDGIATIDDLSVQVNATTPTGWVYLRLDDPSNGQFKVKQVLRSDGTEVRLENVWTTDRTFPATGRPVLENILHILDYNSTGQYSVIYDSGDTIAPQIREIVDVSPDPRNIPVTSIDVVFTEAIRSASFDYTDLMLSLDGGNNLITSAVTVSQVNATTYRINNLAGITGNVGQYQLSLNATGIEDLSGTAGVGTVTESWVFNGDRPAVADLIGFTSNLRNTPVEIVDVVFTEAIVPSSFDFSDLLLTRNNGGNLINASVLVTPINSTTYRISNLTGLTSTDGDYAFLVRAAGVQDLDGNSGTGGKGFNWTLNATAPIVTDIIDVPIDPRSTAVQQLDVVFSKPIDFTTFDFNDLTLTRGSSANLITAATTVSLVSGSTYRITGLVAAQTEDGIYTLTVNGDGIRDTIGNRASGSASETWTIDSVAPTAPSSITISPDRGISNSDRITNTTALTISGTLSESGLSVFLVDQTSGTSLGQATVTGTTFSHSIHFPGAGSRQLQVRVVDAAGNSASNTFDVFLDLTQPTVTDLLNVPAASTTTPVSFIDVVFSEAIDPTTFNSTDLSLTRDGGANLITNAIALTALSSTTYRISGLTSLTTLPGAYELAVNTATLQDRAGNSGDRVTRATFSIANPAQPGIVLTQSEGNTTVTEGATDSYTLVLRTRPTAAVTISLTSDDQTSLDKPTLTFTPDNWNSPQTVLVTAVDDALTEGAHTSLIRHTVSSSDPNYNALSIPDINVAINDNDAEIRGTTWNDRNGNGSKDVGEPGLSGWTIYLDGNENGQFDAGETSTVTDGDGNYRFANLRPGSYTVLEVLQPGWRQTFPNVSVTTTGADIPLYTPSLLETTAATATSATTLINLEDFRSDSRFAGIDGSGFSTVIIDTGIDLDHPFFGADLDRNGIADRIVYQYDFADNDADASDRKGHGSHVASIVGSSDRTYTGVAPGADIIALKVFKDNGTGYFSDLEESLQWVIQNAARYNIASVNLSLGDENNWNTATPRYGIGDELATLAKMNVIVVTAAGNNFAKFGSTPGLAYPASDPNTIAVGAVWSTTDQIADFSQRHATLSDVFAPGIPIIGANATGGTTTMGGTSQASPYVAGIAVLAQELAIEKLNRRLTLEEFRSLLTTTGIVINDGDDERDSVTNTGLNFPRVNLLALAEKILTLNTSSPVQGSSSSTTNSSSDPLYSPSNSLAQAHSITLEAGQVATDLNFGNQQLTPGTIAFSTDTFSIREDGTAILPVRITRTDGSDGEVSATLTLTNGSAIAPTDYTNTPIVVTFADGETTKTISIPIINDALIEPDETLNLTLSNPSNGATLGSQVTAIVTIIDDDPRTETGGNFNDSITGGAGDDSLSGNGGRDSIAGGAGNDLLIGGLDADTLAGGTGRDRFIYTNIREGRDTISDFTPVEDQIDLSQMFAGLNLTYGSAIANGYLSFSSQGSNTAFLVDPDGSVGRVRPIALAVLQGVSAGDLNNVNNFLL